MPYRQNARASESASEHNWRVVRGDPFIGYYTTYHRYHWTAWLAAKWFVMRHSYSEALIQTRN